MNRHNLTVGQQALIASAILMVVGVVSVFTAPSLPVASNYGVATDTNGLLAGSSTNFFTRNSNHMERARSTSPTNSLRTELTNTIIVATNAVTTNFQALLSSTQTIAISRANQVGLDGTNNANTKLGGTNSTSQGQTLASITTNSGAFYNVQSNLVYTGTAGVTQTNVHIDFSFGNEFYLLLTNNAFLIPTNMRPGQVVNVEIWQDGTGSRTVGYQLTITTNAGGMVVSNAANAKSVLTLKSGKYATNAFGVMQAGFQ